ncbi:MAG: gamma-glutamyl-gamma-aminobutyrate hydrolase family protein [Candidatus Fimivivens sp.]
MKPLILLTAGYEISANGQNRRYIYQSYADAVSRAGGIAVLPLDDGTLAEDCCALAQGLLITGGPDLDPALYGEEKHPACGRIDSQRDAMEYKLLDAFVKARKPVLGICRGIQIINSYFGGTLWQDLPSQLHVVHGQDDRPHDCTHMTELTPGSQLHQLFAGSRIMTNSYHHQSVKVIASGFIATATCGGVVEAIEHTTLPILAVQWHPERMTGADRFEHHGPDSAPLFLAFIDQCKKWSQP